MTGRLDDHVEILEEGKAHAIGRHGPEAAVSRGAHAPGLATARRGAQPALAETPALRNGSLQGGYFMLAPRALGLDVGGMSGFDNAGVDKEFFADTEVKSNFLCNVGYADAAALRPRGPRFGFDEIAK